MIAYGIIYPIDDMIAILANNGKQTTKDFLKEQFKFYKSINKEEFEKNPVNY